MTQLTLFPPPEVAPHTVCDRPAMGRLPTTGRRVHLVGAGGAGLQALARVLVEQGWRVTGSDAAPGSAPCGWPGEGEIRRGHRASHLPHSLDLLVYSPAVPPDNPELVAARRNGVPTWSYPEWLGRASRAAPTLAVCGTHGKSTTTALAAGMLRLANAGPTAVFGAESPDPLFASGAGPEGGPLLVEACEYRRHFLELRPNLVVVQRIEPDHFDCFPNFEALRDAFREFAGLLPADGTALVHEDSVELLRLAFAGRRLETFGRRPTCDWQARNERLTPRGRTWDLFHRGRWMLSATLRTPGVHQVENALAAAALSATWGASAEAIAAALTRFSGLRRRLETLGEVHGITFVDDYAHHPSEVSAALAALRERYPGRRLWCLFQPHQGSRLANLLDDFALSLHNADRVLLAPVFRAREATAAAADSSDLAQALVAAGRPAVCLERTEMADCVAALARPGDVVATLGAGDLGCVAHELLRRFDLRAAG